MCRRGWLAVVISCTAHGLLVFGVVLLCAALRSSPESPKPDANRVIDAPDDYGSISISLEEESVKQAPISIRPQAVPPKERDDLPAPKAIAVQSNSTEPQVKQDPGVVQAGYQKPGVVPLHGKMTSAGASIVYVLDQSGSMARDGKLKHAIATLKASLRQLGPDVRFQIVVYDSKPTILRIDGRRELAAASDVNRAEVDALLAEIIGEGSSRHCDGLIAGLGLHPDVLFLLTDADELSPAEVARCKRWNRKGTAIHAAIFGKPKTEHVSLRELTGPDRLHHVEPPDTERSRR